MKFGFICPQVPGHLNPMTALARHLQMRGHEVVFLYSSGARREHMAQAQKTYALTSAREGVVPPVLRPDPGPSSALLRIRCMWSEPRAGQAGRPACSLALSPTMRIPLRKRLEVGLESPEAVSPHLHKWAPL
jgi:hypothetical protein